MVDLSRHLQAAKGALDKGQYDIAIERCEQCVDVDPAQVEIYRILIDACRKKAKITAGSSLFGKLGLPSFGGDPHKRFSGAVKKLSKGFDGKSLAAAADAARDLAATVKPMLEVAIFLYEEHKTTGLFDEKVLWNLANVHFDRFKATGGKDMALLERAIKVITELDKAMPQHAEAGRTLKNWQATQSMLMRNQAGPKNAAGGSTGGDFRSQLANDANARRLEMLNRQIRTPEDAREVLGFLDSDLKTNPGDKAMWVKKGGIHLHFGQLAEAKGAFQKAQDLDAHDFTVTMKIGDVAIAEAKRAIAQAKTAGQDTAPLEAQAIEVEMAEVRKRVERQPTDMGHRFQLGTLLFRQGNIEGAASEFQRTINDARLKKASHKNLGLCFKRKNLLDLAADQYNSFLRLADDDTAEDAKEVRYQLARIYEDSGKKNEAIEHYRRLVNVDLAFKDCADRLAKLQNG
jgi:tetratricopeptide (TPR) repeat protein